jgi:hypothetical protein
MVGVAACSDPGLVLFGGVLYVFGCDGDVDHADLFAVIEGERSGKGKQEHGGDCGLHGTPLAAAGKDASNRTSTWPPLGT